MKSVIAVQKFAARRPSLRSSATTSEPESSAIAVAAADSTAMPPPRRASARAAADDAESGANLLHSDAARSDAVHVDMTRAASVELSEHAPSERDLGADLAGSSRRTAPDDGDDEEAGAAASFSVIIESLVPVRGHVLEASAAETVLSLKQRYLALLRTEARALEAAEASRPSAAAAGAGAAGAPALRSRPSFANDGRVDEGYELSVSLILDGYELVDARTLASYAVVDGARICVVSRRSRSGVGWRLLNEVWRWWPLLGGLALISVLYAEAFGWVPGDDVARCDTPLTPFLACVGPIFVPYGIVFSGVYQKDRGKRLLWFVKARVLNATVAVAALFALGGLVVGAVWLFDGASTCRDDAPQLYYAALLAWLLLVVLNTPWLVLLSLPLLLLCRAPLFFRIVERMSGKDGAPMERRNYVANERKPQLGRAWNSEI